MGQKGAGDLAQLDNITMCDRVGCSDYQEIKTLKISREYLNSLMAVALGDRE